MPMPKVQPEKRVCPVCKTVFEVGGRGRPGRRQRFCSKACNAYARVREHKVKQMSATEAAYLAGLIDGEGSIIAVKRNQKGRITWRLQVASTTPVLLEWCIAITGVGSIVKRKSTNPKHADSQWWQCYSWNAIEVLKRIMPYMILKKNKAQQAVNELSNIQFTYTMTVSAGG